jgi:hypothetical protein
MKHLQGSYHICNIYIKFPDLQKKLNYAPKLSINILTPNLTSTLCNEYTRQQCDAKRKGKINNTDNYLKLTQCRA